MGLNTRLGRKLFRRNQTSANRLFVQTYTPNNIIGGSKGLDVDLSTQHERYRKCVWQNVKGVPHPVEAELLDKWT